MSAQGQIEAPDVLVLGEEHGNGYYQREIIKSLHCLRGMGYKILAVEKPQDVVGEIEDYIKARLNYDEKEAHLSLWRLLVKAGGMAPPIGLRADTGEPSGFETVSSSLDLFAEAAVIGFEIRPVDVPLSQYRVRGGSEVFGPSLAERNLHIAQSVQPRTVLIVGRGHTGENGMSVDSLIRGRGMSVISIDLVGSDEFHYSDDMRKADATVDKTRLTKSGGICKIIQQVVRGREERETSVGGDVP